MIYPLEVIESHLQSPKDSLAYHQLQATLKTNELLTELLTRLGNKQETETIKDFTSFKRPQLMQEMAKHNAPQGWNTWGNEKMVKYLKEVS